MGNTVDEQLESAIAVYVDSFSYKGLVRLVSEDLLNYYTYSADEEEKQMFIELQKAYDD
jgi:hypothetical protein